jgi:glucan-binding repeat-containing protein
MTRGEAATILRRFVELVIDEGTARGWVQNDSGQWQYIGENGRAVTGWLTLDGEKYWFDSNGVMASGKWVQISGKWYYFQADGTLAVNTTIDGYAVGADGARKED